MIQGTAMRPSPTIEKWYQAELQAFAIAMSKVALKEYERAMKSEPSPVEAAQDKASEHVPVQFQIKVKELQDRFNHILETAGSVAAAQFIERQIRHASNAFVQSMRPILDGSASFTLSGHVMTSANEVFIRAAVKENVALIKSVGSQYFERIEREIARSLDGTSKYKSLFEALKEIGGMSERRAKFIAQDQNSKVFSQISVENMRRAGLTKGKWLHSAGGKVPREHHIKRWDKRPGEPNALNGYVFDINNPPIADPKTGERAMPGMLINCGCVLTPVVDI